MRVHWQRQPGDIRSACGRRSTVCSRWEPQLENDINKVDCATWLDLYTLREEFSAGIPAAEAK